MKRHEYSIIARAYGQALHGAARRLGIVDAVQREARELLRLLERTPKLMVFLHSPQIPTEDKLGLIGKVFGARLPGAMINLLSTLVRRERAPHLPAILNLAIALIDEERGIYPAELASGHPLTADDRARLEGVLQRYTGCRLKIDWSVEPSLIGGIVFRFRDLLVDGSLRSGLAEIRRRWRQTSMVRGAA